MSEMVERVKAAIKRHIELHDFDGFDDVEKAAEDCARAAIQEMREPTEGMADKGGEVDNLCDHNVSDMVANEVWKAMIDEALK